MPEVSTTDAQRTGRSSNWAITLDVTPPMMATLQEMSRDSGLPLNVVFTRAIGLYKAALDATAKGKHFGYADSSDALEVEFTGIARDEG